MKISNSFFVTRREFPNDEVTDSMKYLVKSGMVIKNENGIYTYLPLGLKVIENIKKIIKEEFMKINASEIFLPTLINNELYKSTSRDRIFDKELFTLKDRNNNYINLSITDEEAFSLIAKNKIKSYKDLHFTLYQINNKYRDEEKAKYGLTRKKEFMVSSATSFDVDESGLDVSYDKMFLTFKKIFNRLGIETIVVESSPIYMNNVVGEEFQVISKYGDNEIVKCTNCSYACNIEDASSKSIYTNREIEYKQKKLVYTPNVKTIKDISEYLNVFSSNILKSLILKIDDEYKMFLLKGESELNINKLKKIFKTNNIVFPTENELEKIGTSVGFVGPIGSTMEIIADNEIKSMHNFICGSNKKNYHYINVNVNRDFKINRYADIKLFDKNSLCPVCKSKCNILKGIEVGQLFKMGTYFSELFDLHFTNELNNQEYVQLGSYQIGIDRCMSAIVENNHDENGIIWPFSVAPFKVSIVPTNMNDKEILKYSKLLHDKLNEIGIDTILDDRKETVGIKFNDMDLIGIPIRITIGKKFIEEELIEVKFRNNLEVEYIEKSKVVEYIKEIIKEKL